MAYTNDKKKIHHAGLSLKAVAWTMGIIGMVISTLLMVSLFMISGRYREVNKSTTEYVNWKDITQTVQHASDYLTDEVRTYVVTRKDPHLENYFVEAKITQRREKSLSEIETYLGHTEVYNSLVKAIDESNKLMFDEYYAMRLIVDVKGYDIADYPQEIQDVELPPEVAALTNDEKVDLAFETVFGDSYTKQKEAISSDVNNAITALDALMEKKLYDASEALKTILIVQQILITMNVGFIIALVIIVYFYVVRPIKGGVNSLLNEEQVNVNGLKEYRYLAETYNTMLEQNVRNKEKLIYEAEHDKLTGLYNRTGYDSIFRRVRLEKCCYVLIDVDKFKQINDENGHEVGDRVLVRVAKLLNEKFYEDHFHIFRIGGDEFSIILENVSRKLTDEIVRRMDDINEALQLSNGYIPPVSLSVGVAFGQEDDTTDKLFRRADKALYQTKNSGRGHVTVYEDNKN